MSLNATLITKIQSAISATLSSITILTGTVLVSNTVSADNTESVDQVNLIVPIACTMTGTGTTHTATLSPGTYSGASGNEYENGIGKTTLTAICNDDNGFSIYAIGYTGNSYDSENHTKLVGTNTGGTISTKAYESGDTTSNWSMKLTKVDNPASGDPVTYNPENLTISTGYNTWHAVPAGYTKVAEYHANTGSSTTDTTRGVKLETTYAAYIASNQPADTYVGQVKYTMVHPYDAEKPKEPVRKQITVTYDAASGGWFGNDTSKKTNEVVYEAYCSNQRTDHLVFHTPNIDDSGNKQISIMDTSNPSYFISDINVPGANKLMITLHYDLLFNEENSLIENQYGNYYEYGGITVYGGNNATAYYGTGTQTIIIDGNSAGIEIYYDNHHVTIDPEHDYGYYATVYPLNDNDETYLIDEPCLWTTIEGIYLSPTPRTDIPHYISFYGWNGPDGFNTTDTSDYQVLQFLQDNGLPDEATFTAWWMS